MSSGVPEAVHSVRTVVVLAGERPGGNALARAHDADSSLTLDLNGKPVIDWTLAAIDDATIDQVLLVGPGEAAANHPSVLEWCKRDNVRQIAPAAGPAASAVKGAEAAENWPVLLTAADHALLQGAHVDSFCEQAQATAQHSSSDLVVGLVDYVLVQQRFPNSKRTLLKFSDGACCGSNLFLLATPDAVKALRVWSRLEALRKQPWKIAWGLGLGVCLRYLLGALSVEQAFAALSERTGIRVSFCKLSEPELAVDVDSVADLQLASAVLHARGGD